MRSLLLILLLLCAAACQADPMLVRITAQPTDIERLSAQGYAIVTDELPGVVDLLVDDLELQALSEAGYEPQILMPYAEARFTDVDPEYHTYTEMTQELQALAAQYPSICKLDSIGYAPHRGRAIWSVKLSDNVAEEEDELALYYFGGHHGPEPVGTETLIYMIDHFLTQYGSDPQITDWIDRYEIFFVPLVNPDGHEAVIVDYHPCWRKNASDLNQNGRFFEYRGTGTFDDIMEGVDLNRNYDYYWATGGPTDPRNSSYIGPSAFSETELHGIRDLGYAQNFVCGISLHSYGEIVLYPWYGPPYPPDLEVIQSMAAEMADCFRTDAGGPYTYDFAWGQSGQCRNWFYAVLGAISYCVELNPTGLAIPPGSELEERNQRYMQGAMYLLDRLSGPGVTGHVTDAVTGEPLAANIEVIGMMSSYVEPRYSDAQYGRFTRLLNPGTYTLQAVLPGYQYQQVPDVVVAEGWTEVDIELVPVATQTGNIPVRPSTRLPDVLGSGGGPLEISFDLPVAGRVELAVYDIAGREVATIVDGWRDCGPHDVIFDASHLTSGIYVYRLTASNFSGVGKMVLIK